MESAIARIISSRVRPSFGSSSVTEVRFELVTVQRQKYRCACQACIDTAPGPERAVAGSRYALDLALKVVVDKYMHSLPLTRQAAMFAQLGLVTSSSTLWDLVYQIGTRLELVSDALLTYALQQRVVGIDETSWPRLDDASRNPWQMWAITVSGLGTCAVAVHRIRDDKGAATMTALIGDFNGVLVCDQAATHGAVDKHNAHIELAGCWADIMRRFKEAAEDFPMASVAADLIRMLYDVDATLADKRQALQGRTLDDEAVVEYFRQLLTLRQLASRDVCAQLHVWLLANRGPTTISIHDAVEHTLKYWHRLTRFLDDPMIPLDNNATERVLTATAIRSNLAIGGGRSGAEPWKMQLGRLGLGSSRPWFWQHAIWIEAMLVAPRVAEDLDAMTVLGKAIDESVDAGGARENGAPLFVGQVGSDDSGPLFVAARDNIVKHVSGAGIAG
jgi:transposase